MPDRPIGVLVMAYGTASGPDDVERYYTDIRGGRAPSAEHLRELLGRYAAIGNRFPLLEITREQAEGLQDELNRTRARMERLERELRAEIADVHRSYRRDVVLYRPAQHPAPRS